MRINTISAVTAISRITTAIVRLTNHVLCIRIDGLSAHDCRHHWATRAATAGTDAFVLRDAPGEGVGHVTSIISRLLSSCSPALFVVFLALQQNFGFVVVFVLMRAIGSIVPVLTILDDIECKSCVEFGYRYQWCW